MWGLSQFLFANLILFFYESKWMNELKKYEFRFFNDLSAIDGGGEFESNYCNIYPEEFKLGKEDTDKHEANQ